MSEYHRDDLIRMNTLTVAPLEFRAAEEDGDGRTMVGYPILFNEWTEINGWEGNFLERIDPGAVRKTLAERRDQVKVLFNHGFDPQIGDKPLGKPSVMTPDARGLYAEVPLARVTYNEDLIELMRVGAIDGQSFRFSVTREDWNEEPDASDHNPRALPERTIKELKLFEFGPVTFPAYQATTAGVRARSAYEAWRTSPLSGFGAAPGTPESDDDTPPAIRHLSVAQVAAIAAARDTITYLRKGA